METNEIKITLCSKKVFKLKSDAPDLDGLISAFVEHKDAIDPKAITVDCENEDFDKDGFTEVLINAFKHFKEDLRLEEDQYNAEIERLNPQKSKTAK